MEIPLYQLDAFTDRPFAGNPAAVCPLGAWPDETVMQAIAAENNLSETAFLVREGAGWRIRWFSPACEVPLCGHATLAAAEVVLTRLDSGAEAVRFESRSGPLNVIRRDGRLVMDFPALPAAPCEVPADLIAGLGARPGETFAAAHYLAVLADEEAVCALAPDMAALARLHPRGIIATAPGRKADFVSRFFGPSFGIPEDPVTGSAHCTLAPYWAERLGRPALHARQVSARGGELFCEVKGERVEIGGTAALYLEGTVRI